MSQFEVFREVKSVVQTHAAISFEHVHGDCFPRNHKSTDKLGDDIQIDMNISDCANDAKRNKEKKANS